MRWGTAVKLFNWNSDCRNAFQMEDRKIFDFGALLGWRNVWVKWQMAMTMSGDDGIRNSFVLATDVSK